MDKIFLENLFIKRYCLPVNSDIQLYESGNKSIEKCVCSNFNHISCVLQGKTLRILTTGINKNGDELKTPGVHAEHAAISKLMPLKNKKRLKKIDILVIRLSPKNKLQSSKPCSHCIKIMMFLPNKKGYSVRDIYYSDTNGNIIKTTLKKLYNEDTKNKYFSQYYRNKNRLIYQ